MSLALGVLLEGIRDSDWPIAEVLAVHGLDSSIRGIEAGEVDEGIALRVTRVWVSHDLGRLQDDTKGAKCVIEKLFVNLWVKVADEYVGTHIQIFVVR